MLTTYHGAHKRYNRRDGSSQEVMKLPHQPLFILVVLEDFDSERYPHHLVSERQRVYDAQAPQQIIRQVVSLPVRNPCVSIRTLAVSTWGEVLFQFWPMVQRYRSLQSILQERIGIDNLPA